MSAVTLIGSMRFELSATDYQHTFSDLILSIRNALEPFTFKSASSFSCGSAFIMSSATIADDGTDVSQTIHEAT